ncbi:DUF883 family protein [Roseibium salinum]|uniref:DUF883 C-terminal domain-containing protein n=1 Tax=Roseibium salinum TaxID=1604349 RepID=A0ABT3R4B9_9HYPH|nr:DUF883 C-terminal domain-containing protein [Roseibium sp. DSM 29163]MCX2723935.1 DUF883 C-terminal domain-containing protein [Roseibium sp. DSM 29163]MDN3718260.1 DUF883 C-terminal domain-containing protein [Roseibium salinum]
MAPRNTTTSTSGDNSAKHAATQENWDQVTEQLQKLREDIGNVSSALQGLARAGVTEGQDRAMAQMDGFLRHTREMTDELTDQGKRAARKASDTANSAAREAEDAIHRNPLTALAVALGLGFLIGLISRRQ